MRRVFVVAVAVVCAGCWNLHAAEDAAQKKWKDEEAKSRASEEGRDPYYRLVPGKVRIDVGDLTDDQKSRIASLDVGAINSNDGKTYILRVPTEDMLNRLRAVNNSEAVIGGSLRVDGKYLVVENISTASPTPIKRGKRGGV